MLWFLTNLPNFILVGLGVGIALWIVTKKFSLYGEPTAVEDDISHWDMSD